MKFCTQQQILNWMNVTLRLFICIGGSHVTPTDHTYRHWFVQHSSVEKRFQTGTEY